MSETLSTMTKPTKENGKRTHIAIARRTLCNKLQTPGDYDITVTGQLGIPGPSNLCKVCQHIYLR